MANNDLMVNVGLNIDASVDNIEKQLKNVNERLDKDHALKIIANIDLSKTTQRIQSQLATISKNLNLDIGKINVDTNITNVVSEVHNALSNTNTDFKINVNESALDNMRNSLHSIGLELEKDIDKAEGIQKIVSYFKELNIQITKVKPKFEETSSGVKRLVSLSVQGINTNTGAIVNIVDQLDNSKKNVAKTTTTITQNLAKIEQENKKVEDSAKAAQLVYNEFLKLKGQADVYSKQYAGEDSLKTQLGEIRYLVGVFDETSPLEKQRENIILIGNELKKLKVDIDAIKDSTDKNTGSVEDWHRKQNLLLQDYDILAAKIKKANLDINEVATRDGVNYNELFQNLTGGDITNSDDLSRARDALSAIRKEFQLLNAQMVSDLPQNVIENLIQGMNKADSQIKVLTVDYEKLENPSQELIQSFEKLKSLAENFDFSTDFENETKEGLEKKIKDYTRIKVALNDTQSALKAFQKEEKKAFQEDNRLANLQNRISKLTAEVNRYATANQRATTSMKEMSNGKTFAVEWSRITTEMAKGVDLTDRELKDLAADMAVFKKEAQAAGLAGQTAFGKFLNSFKTMSSYITANMVFNFVKRQVRELVNEVTEVDTAMTELRKVTEATNEEFEAFAVSAGKTGRELGASVSDVINATAEFARLGESLPDAEELGRVATLYKNVGDGIDITTASEDIVSTMKAFKIEAKDAITIVDKLNEVGNNFAISSGGIGEALKRSASALAAANNDISESIALITTANTVAQDPTTVGQGIKTVSLRLRSTKTELEDLGEDAEGAAENVSKLRQQMLALTGVDIQLDDSTYKSTYQILLEISKVWGRLDDLTRSSVLEQLFGKRQANIGAAILENGELLEQVYKKSEKSAGSAMREQEEYAKSIQYSIDTLKAAYQDFADSVVNNDFVKNLLGTAQSFLEVLTKIIDGFGTLPTILTTIAAIGGVKNVGIFGSWSYGLTTLTDKLTALKQVANYDFGKLFKDYKININGLDAKDIDALQKYVNLLDDANATSEDFLGAMGGMSKAAKAQTTSFNSLNIAYKDGIISEQKYREATQNLALAQKTATTTTKALTVAMNVLGNVAIMVVVNLAVKGLSKLVDKLVVTKEELDEMRESSIESIEALSDSIDELVEKESKIDDLLQQYRKIVSSTDDITESKDELLTIQDDIIKQFGAEKDSIDLLNDSYETTIAKIKELSEEEYKRWKRNNAEKISEYEDLSSLNVRFTGKAVLNDEITSLDLDASNPDKYSSRLNDLYESYYIIKDVDKEITDISKTIDGIGISYKGWLKDDLTLSGDIREAYEQLGQLLDAVDASGSSASVAALSKRYEELGRVIQEIDNYLEKQKQHEAETFEPIGELSIPNIDKLKDIVAVAGDARSEWFEAFKEIQDGAGKTVDTISSALQTISEGKGLSSADFWKLMEFDTNKVLTDIKMVGNEFVINEQQLVQLKDDYINSQINSLKLKNKEKESDIADLKITIDKAKAEMALLGARGLATQEQRNAYNAAQRAIEQAEANLVDYGNQIQRNNILIEEWRSKLGYIVDQQSRLTEEVKKAQEYADNLLKAQEYKIDQIINGHEAEKEALEAEKEILEDELDVLEQQQSELEEIISNYESVNKLVQNTVKKEIESLEEQKKAIEDTYNKRIDALKAENEERSDALEYAQKLANLENAKNNKVRVIDETRGFRYESKKEDVVKAEAELKNFENEQSIKELEKQRDQETAAIDDIIESKQKYSDQWSEILDLIKTEEDELLAEEILGADWREKIASGDMEIMDTFRTAYLQHNGALKNITNTEIKLKKAAIEAKDAEIKSKQQQIDTWKKYKTTVQDAAKLIKDSTEEYMKLIPQVEGLETGSLQARETNLNNFKTAYEDALNTAIEKQKELDGLNKDFSFDVSVYGLDELQQAVDKVKELGIEYNATAIGKYLFENADKLSKDDVNDLLYGYGDTSTNRQGAKWYGAPNTASLYKTLSESPLTTTSTVTRKGAPNVSALQPTTNTSNVTVNIDKIVTDSPADFAKQLDQYCRTKLTANYTRN